MKCPIIANFVLSKENFFLFLTSFSSMSCLLKNDSYRKCEHIKQEMRKCHYKYPFNILHSIQHWGINSKEEQTFSFVIFPLLNR